MAIPPNPICEYSARINIVLDGQHETIVDVGATTVIELFAQIRPSTNLGGTLAGKINIDKFALQSDRYGLDLEATGDFNNPEPKDNTSIILLTACL